ncbi:membrane protein [Salmonella phage Se-J]|uniref:membrane protein n=1 Tax=Salmonella phage Se-J TaxID=2698910 RepID=UPI0018AF8966|nr:membrane protein [Salmonella phage Se-J]
MVIIDSTDILISVFSIIGVFTLVCSIKKSIRKKVVDVVVASDLQLEDTKENSKDIKQILASRVTKRISQEMEDFSLEQKDPNTTPEEYFQYFMEGLGWPFIEYCILRTNYFYVTIVCKGDQQVAEPKQRVWFYNYSDSDNHFLVSLHRLFKEYMDNGSTQTPTVETVESIVERARARNESKSVYLSKYGFVWKEDI